MRIIDKLKLELSKVVNNRFERKVRSKLKNDQFTILCPTCIGGVIYHRLGKQFLSPTINMWMSPGDFLIFLENLQDFLAEELRFVESTYSHPVAQLSVGDKCITLYFNHAKTEDEAKENWERRKVRVNYDNLYIITYDYAGISEDELRRLEKIPCKNMAVLSEKVYPDRPYVVTLKRSPKEPTNFLNKDWFGMRTFEKQWDFVSFLNT